MSNTQYRAPAQPAQPTQPFDPILAARQREIGRVLADVGREFFEQHGGKEIDAAIALLRVFSVDGQEYARKLLLHEAEEIEQARKEAALPKPDETRLHEGSKARELVKKARKTKYVIDAASATRLCKLLIDMVQLRQALLRQMTSSIEELFMVVSDGKGMDTTLPKEAIERLLRAEAQLV